jgi:hypothetical protein
MTVTEMLDMARALSLTERKELVKGLVDLLDAPVAKPRKRRMSEFEGIAAHLADDEDPQDYLRRLRAEWDDPS